MSGPRKNDNSDIAESVKAVCEKILSADEFLDKLVNAIVRKLENTWKQEKQEYPAKVDLLYSELCETKNKIVDLEKQHRLPFLRFYGLSLSQDGSSDLQEAVKVCKKIHSLVDELDIDYVCRGRKSKKGEQPLIVKFARSKIRNAIFYNKSKLKGSLIVAKEEFVPAKYKLLLEAETELRRGRAWTNQGRIR